MQGLSLVGEHYSRARRFQIDSDSLARLARQPRWQQEEERSISRQPGGRLDIALPAAAAAPPPSDGRHKQRAEPPGDGGGLRGRTDRTQEGEEYEQSGFLICESLSRARARAERQPDSAAPPPPVDPTVHYRSCVRRSEYYTSCSTYYKTRIDSSCAHLLSHYFAC